MRNDVIGTEADLALRGWEKRPEEERMGQNGTGCDGTGQPVTDGESIFYIVYLTGVEF